MPQVPLVAFKGFNHFHRQKWRHSLWAKQATLDVPSADLLNLAGTCLENNFLKKPWQYIHSDKSEPLRELSRLRETIKSSPIPLQQELPQDIVHQIETCNFTQSEFGCDCGLAGDDQLRQCSHVEPATLAHCPPSRCALPQLLPPLDSFQAGTGATGDNDCIGSGSASDTTLVRLCTHQFSTCQLLPVEDPLIDECGVVPLGQEHFCVETPTSTVGKGGLSDKPIVCCLPADLAPIARQSAHILQLPPARTHSGSEKPAGVPSCRDMAVMPTVACNKHGAPIVAVEPLNFAASRHRTTSQTPLTSDTGGHLVEHTVENALSTNKYRADQLAPDYSHHSYATSTETTASVGNRVIAAEMLNKTAKTTSVSDAPAKTTVIVDSSSAKESEFNRSFHSQQRRKLTVMTAAINSDASSHHRLSATLSPINGTPPPSLISVGVAGHYSKLESCCQTLNLHTGSDLSEGSGGSLMETPSQSHRQCSQGPEEVRNWHGAQATGPSCTTTNSNTVVSNSCGSNKNVSVQDERNCGFGNDIGDSREGVDNSCYDNTVESGCQSALSIPERKPVVPSDTDMTKVATATVLPTFEEDASVYDDHQPSTENTLKQPPLDTISLSETEKQADCRDLPNYSINGTESNKQITSFIETITPAENKVSENNDNFNSPHMNDTSMKTQNSISNNEKTLSCPATNNCVNNEISPLINKETNANFSFITTQTENIEELKAAPVICGINENKEQTSATGLVSATQGSSKLELTIEKTLFDEKVLSTQQETATQLEPKMNVRESVPIVKSVDQELISHARDIDTAIAASTGKLSASEPLSTATAEVTFTPPRFFDSLLPSEATNKHLPFISSGTNTETVSSHEQMEQFSDQNIVQTTNVLSNNCEPIMEAENDLSRVSSQNSSSNLGRGSGVDVFSDKNGQRNSTGGTRETKKITDKVIHSQQVIVETNDRDCVDPSSKAEFVSATNTVNVPFSSACQLASQCHMMKKLNEQNVVERSSIEIAIANEAHQTDRKSSSDQNCSFNPMKNLCIDLSVENENKSNVGSQDKCYKNSIKSDSIPAVPNRLQRSSASNSTMTWNYEAPQNIIPDEPSNENNAFSSSQYSVHSSEIDRTRSEISSHNSNVSSEICVIAEHERTENLAELNRASEIKTINKIQSVEQVEPITKTTELIDRRMNERTTTRSPYTTQSEQSMMAGKSPNSLTMNKSPQMHLENRKALTNKGNSSDSFEEVQHCKRQYHCSNMASCSVEFKTPPKSEKNAADNDHFSEEVTCNAAESPSRRLATSSRVDNGKTKYIACEENEELYNDIPSISKDKSVKSHEIDHSSAQNLQLNSNNGQCVVYRISGTRNDYNAFLDGHNPGLYQSTESNRNSFFNSEDCPQSSVSNTQSFPRQPVSGIAQLTNREYDNSYVLSCARPVENNVHSRTIPHADTPRRPTQSTSLKEEAHGRTRSIFSPIVDVETVLQKTKPLTKLDIKSNPNHLQNCFEPSSVMLNEVDESDQNKNSRNARPYELNYNKHDKAQKVCFIENKNAIESDSKLDLESKKLSASAKFMHNFLGIRVEPTSETDVESSSSRELEQSAISTKNSVNQESVSSNEGEFSSDVNKRIARLMKHAFFNLGQENSNIDSKSGDTSFFKPLGGSNEFVTPQTSENVEVPASFSKNYKASEDQYYDSNTESYDIGCQSFAEEFRRQVDRNIRSIVQQPVTNIAHSKNRANQNHIGSCRNGTSNKRYRSSVSSASNCKKSRFEPEVVDCERRLMLQLTDKSNYPVYPSVETPIGEKRLLLQDNHTSLSAEVYKRPTIIDDHRHSVGNQASRNSSTTVCCAVATQDHPSPASTELANHEGYGATREDSDKSNVVVVLVNFTDQLFQCMRVVASAASILLDYLQLSDQSTFTSASTNTTRLLLAQMSTLPATNISSHERKQLRRRYKSTLALHGLLKSRDMLRHASVCHVINQLIGYSQTHSEMIQDFLDETIEKLKQVAAEEDACSRSNHPSVDAALVHITQRLGHPADHNKVLVVAFPESSSLLQELHRTLSSANEKSSAIVDSVTPANQLFTIIQSSAVVLLQYDEKLELTRLPLDQFSLIIQLPSATTGSSSSSSSSGGGAGQWLMRQCGRGRLQLLVLDQQLPDEQQLADSARVNTETVQCEASVAPSISAVIVATSQTAYQQWGLDRVQQHGIRIVVTQTSGAELAGGSASLLQSRVAPELFLAASTCVLLRSPKPTLTSLIYRDVIAARAHCSRCWLIVVGDTADDRFFSHLKSLLSNVMSDKEFCVRLLHVQTTSHLIDVIVDIVKSTDETECWRCLAQWSGSISGEHLQLLQLPGVNVVTAHLLTTLDDTLLAGLLRGHACLSELTERLPMVPVRALKALTDTLNSESTTNAIAVNDTTVSGSVFVDPSVCTSTPLPPLLSHQRSAAPPAGLPTPDSSHCPLPPAAAAVSRPQLPADGSYSCSSGNMAATTAEQVVHGLVDQVSPWQPYQECAYQLDDSPPLDLSPE